MDWGITMTLTRTHYNAIANILIRHGTFDENKYLKEFIGEFCEYFHRDNARFDTSRFIETITIGIAKKKADIEEGKDNEHMRQRKALGL